MVLAKKVTNRVKTVLKHYSTEHIFGNMTKIIQNVLTKKMRCKKVYYSVYCPCMREYVYIWLYSSCWYLRFRLCKKENGTSKIENFMVQQGCFNR